MSSEVRLECQLTHENDVTVDYQDFKNQLFFWAKAHNIDTRQNYVYVQSFYSRLLSLRFESEEIFMLYILSGPEKFHPKNPGLIRFVREENV